jgi:hypothetical protein
LAILDEKVLVILKLKMDFGIGTRVLRHSVHIGLRCLVVRIVTRMSLRESNSTDFDASGPFVLADSLAG